MIGRQVICSRCRREATCRAVLDVQHAPRRVFCEDACMVLYVRENYIECHRVPATPAEAPGPPSGRVSAGIGGDSGSAVRGSAVGTGSPPSEASAPCAVVPGRFSSFLRAVRP